MRTLIGMPASPAPVTSTTTLLVNPPLWNAYAPHLAVPLLAGVLRGHGLPVHSHDASIAVLDWVLSRDGQVALADRLQTTSDEHLAAKAALVHRHVVDSVDRAKEIIRDAASLHDKEQQSWARTVMRNAMWCASAAFEGFTFDLVANQLYYEATSTEAVLAAVDDPERNLYRWAEEQMLPGHLLEPANLGVVGLSVSADTQLIAAMTIARRVRRLRPDVKVVVGGNYTTRMVERWTARHPFFDLVDAFVLAEGEESLPALVKAWDAGASGAGIPGVVIADGDGLSTTPARPVRLDTVPPPDFTELPLGRYFAPGPIVPLYASRSCAWSCAFCSIPFASNNFRRRPGSTTVDHMESLMREHGVRHFMFVDEIMTLNVLREVATEIVDRGLDLYWYGETRFAGGFDRGLAELLYASGCRRLNFGLESYNQRVLDLMRKGTKLAHIDSTVELMLQAGIPPHLFVIHGFPGETAEEAQRTIDYAKGVVARSEREFGNPYTTWGGAPFVLDVHSPVGQRPEEFGIAVIDPPEGHDLALARDYRVLGGGLDRGAAELLARQARDATAIKQNVWFRSHSRIALAEVEEFTFLRACTGAPAAAARRHPVLRHALSNDDVLRLSGSCAVLPWTADDSGRESALALYNGDRDTFAQLNWPLGVGDELLSSGPTVHELARHFAAHGATWGGVTGVDLVTLLVRHGLLAASSAALDPGPDPRFSAEPAVLQTTDGDDAWILHHPTTGGTVRLGALGQVVWLSCLLAPTARSSVVDWYGGTSAQDRVAEASATFDDLAELGFLFVDEPLAAARTAPSPASVRAGLEPSPAPAGTMLR